MALNPNWPVIDYAVSWANGPQQSVLQPYWCSMLERTDASKGGQAGGRRGKQYELDQVQPAEMTLSLQNKDGALDPANPNSPYAGYVLPYRLFRMRAQWPPTPNVLTQNQACSGDADSVAAYPQIEQPFAIGVPLPTTSVYSAAGITSTVVASGSAWRTGGAHVFNHACTTGVSGVVVGMQGWSVAAGQQYSFTTHARCLTASGTVGLVITWYDVTGATITTAAGITGSVNGTTTWTTLTLTATAPVNAAGAMIGLNVSGLPASYSLQTDGWDARKDSTAAWSKPGIWYPLFTGYIERWPQRWTDSGIYGLVDLMIVDEFAVLSQRNILAPFKADLMALNPNFLYALDETSGTSAFADTTGNRGPAIVAAAQYGNTITSGSSLSSADNAPPGPDLTTALTGAFLGTAGPSLMSMFPPVTTGIVTVFGGGAVQIPANPATGLVGPPSTGGYTRIIAGRLTAIPGSQGFAWTFQGPAGSAVTAFVTNPVGAPSYLQAGANNGATTGIGNIALPVVSNSAGVLLDGDWHLFSISLSSDYKTLTIRADSGAPVTVTTASSMSPAPGRANAGNFDIIGAQYFPTLAQFATQWPGNLALACELPFTMTNTIWASLAQSWRNAWSTVPGTTETSDQRYARILAWLKYVGPSRISAGLCKSMGPATDIAVQPTTPTQGLQALQNVVDTENGQHFIGADGAVVFQSRADRYNKTTAVTFGEKTSLGEIPYLEAKFGFDPTRVGNDVQVTAQYGSALYRQQDATSQNTYGAIQLQRTINSVNPNELTAAAQALLLYNKQAQQRLETLVLDPSSNPAIWPTILALELGVACTVNRRPQLATSPISLPGFIEQITWALDGTTNQMIFTLQVSNSTNHTVAQWNTTRYAPVAFAMRSNTTLTASATSMVIITAGGQPTMTTKPGSYPLTIQLDQEQIQLNSAPASGTSPQTFTITRGRNGTTAAAHAASAVVTMPQSQYAY